MKKSSWVDKLLLLIVVGALCVSALGIYQYVSQPNGLIVRWSTENELEILGFNLYRADCGVAANCDPQQSAYQKLTATPIPANADPIAASDYEYADADVPSGLYAYIIETLYLDGSAERSDSPLVLQMP